MIERECEIRTGPEDSICSIHVQATLMLQASGWQANHPEPRAFRIDRLWLQCSETVDAARIYPIARSGGLRFQLRFRTGRRCQ